MKLIGFVITLFRPYVVVTSLQVMHLYLNHLHLSIINTSAAIEKCLEIVIHSLVVHTYLMAYSTGYNNGFHYLPKDKVETWLAMAAAPDLCV